MICGIGIDISQVERIRRAHERFGERFLDRIYTTVEQAYCFRKKYPYESLAARFAVKEAAFKALGHGWSACGGYRSVEVVNEPSGCPTLRFYGKARMIADTLAVSRSFVTITHDGGISAAVVVLERN